MSRDIRTWSNPYGEGFKTCWPKIITINPGLTVLVGCNGAGKTTLLHNIKDELYNNDIPYAEFDNLHNNGLDSAIFNENFGFAGFLMSSSEGESIRGNIGMFSSGIRKFLETGKYSRSTREESIANIFISDDCKNKAITSKERWILLDATDSGYSIDNVIELKDLFDQFQEDADKFGVELYIIISANEYELANGEECFDVNTGKYITFKDYEEYKKFIIKSRKKKDKRLKRIYGEC